MKKFYRATCKNCGRRFRVPKLKKIRIQQPEYGLDFEMDIENVIQNNYHYEKETPKGKAVLDLKDLKLDLTCPFCKETHTYLAKELVHTDRLD